MIYLIGTRHEFQHDSSSSVKGTLKNKFVSYLESKVNEFNATLIAEEFNEEALQNATGTVKYVAEKLNIKHLFCDPNTEERKNIGIPSRKKIKSALNIQGPVYEDSIEDNQIKEEQKKYHPIRENFWFNQIKKHTDGIIIFVCGQDHIISFESLLIGNKCKTKVLESYLG